LKGIAKVGREEPVIVTTPGVWFKRLAAGERGTALTEVGLLLFFIAVITVTLVQTLGQHVTVMFGRAVGMFVH
jgi:Flp pilus assembly pilin Flp